MPNEPLTDADLAAEEAVDLPDREALSLFDTGSLLGGTTALPTDPGTAPADPSTSPPAPAPTDPATAPADPTAGGDPTGLTDKFGGLQGKFVG